MSVQVQSEAFKATVAFITHLDTAQLRSRFTDMLPLLLAIVGKSVEGQEDDSLLKAFIDLGEQCPKFLRPQLDATIELMLKIMALTDLEDSWRQLALEVLVTTSENAPAMMRKQSRYLPEIVSQCLKFMLEVEEDSDWLTADNLEDEDDSTSNAIVGETSLDRLANALGGKVILPHIIRNITSMLRSEDWHCRHAMLMAISAVGEGCEKQVQPILGDVVQAVLPYCQDQHPRVRYAACNALGQLANDFAPTLQLKHHSKVIPALLIVLDDYATPRVQTHAGAALVNFFEQCTQTVLSQYLEHLVPKLKRVLEVRLEELHKTGKKLVLEQIVTTIATLADSVEAHFIPHYDHFMPSLKYIMINATDKEYRLLRGKTIECISLMGLAVGQEKFMQDAQDIMEVLVKAQANQGEMEPDDPQVSYFISAWARMCKIIGPGFVQYLPIVMGPLMQAASIKPEIAIVDSDTENNFNEDDGWEFVTLADQQKFGIKTAGLDEKCTAMQMLVVYAKDLKEGFADFAEPVTQIMVPHLRFYFHELVRAAAAEILPHLLGCVQVKGIEVVRKVWGYMSDKLLEAINLEPDPEIVGIMMDSLCRCIELLGANCFTADQYSKLVELLKDAMEMTFSRASERLKKREDEDYDEQVEEELEEEGETDEQYLSKVADVMHSLFATHGATLLPLFDQLLPTFASMLAEERPSYQKQLSLCVFDDVLEFASSSAVKYQEYFLQPMLKCICDKSPTVRQAASYGVGVMAQNCSKDFSQACLDALSLLTMAIQRPGAKEDIPSINATENAISAITKICRHVETGVPMETILPLWFSWLPVVEDKEEAPHVYSYLCDLIENNNALILGQNNGNVPQILLIIAAVCEVSALEEDKQVFLRLLSIARHIQASTEIWEVCMKLLTHEQQTALQSALA
jgi:hypothetical protein